MKELIVQEDRELRRLETAIADLRRDPSAAHTSRLFLLRALEAERDEVLRSYGGRRPRRMSRGLAV
jgi:hypothetical protein